MKLNSRAFSLVEVLAAVAIIGIIAAAIDALRAAPGYERALAADPGYAMARFGRAQALQQAHRIAEAVEDYGKFLALKPAHHEARSRAR